MYVDYDILQTHIGITRKTIKYTSRGKKDNKLNKILKNN